MVDHHLLLVLVQVVVVPVVMASIHLIHQLQEKVEMVFN
tara:strand:+ start:221 stop:337 length:117 start_codon:yes stop_codon:yes gene_type:complete